MSPYIIWWAIAVHLAWGAALVVDASIAPVAILVGLHWIVTIGVSGPILGVALMLAAGLAGLSLVLDHRLSGHLSFLLLMPQYALMVAALISDGQSVTSGSVAGHPVDRLLLFTALWPVMVAALMHSAAIVERHMAWNRNRR